MVCRPSWSNGFADSSPVGGEVDRRETIADEPKARGRPCAAWGFDGTRRGVKRDLPPARRYGREATTRRLHRVGKGQFWHPPTCGRPSAAWGFDYGRITRDQLRSTPKPYLPRVTRHGVAGALIFPEATLWARDARHGVMAKRLRMTLDVSSQG